MATSKLISEVQQIINSNNSLFIKVKLLKAVNTEKRQGAVEARNLIKNFLTEVDSKRNQKFPKQGKRHYYRGYTKKAYLQKIWFEKFCNYLKTKIDSTEIYGQYASKYDLYTKCMVYINKKHGTSFIQYSDIPQKYAKDFEFIYCEIIKTELEEKRLKDVFEKETGLDRSLFNKKRTIQEVNDSKHKYCYCQVGETFFLVDSDSHESWDKYSKGWHNSHGAYRWTDNRRVIAIEKNKRTEYPLDAFAGNYLIKVIVEHFNIQPIKVTKGLKSIQLQKYFDVVLIRTIGNTKIYKRTLAGFDYDFCVVDANGTNYHANSIENCIKGLRQKAELAAKSEAERLEKENTILTAEICHKQYGFCWEGMRSFCDLNQLDVNSSYTIKELRNVVVQNRKENCDRYKAELKQIGIALNCK